MQCPLNITISLVCELFLDDIVWLLRVSPELCSPVTHFILVIHCIAALFTGGGQ